VNIVDVSPMGRRAYDNSLRTEQAEQTRLRILEAAIAIASDEADLSIGAIASRAGVSEPTVYRHFPNREALIAALADHADTKLGAPPVPSDIGELGPSAIAMAIHLGNNRAWVRAGMRVPEYRELRMRGRRRRVLRFKELVAECVAHLGEHDRDVAFAAFATTMRGETWDYIVSDFGLSDEDAGRAMAFVLEACVEKLARQARAKKSTIVEQASVDRARELVPPTTPTTK
jgi:AcrR family transcriptional regulator